MKDKKNIAVIGCGYWGKNLVRNIAELGHLYAVCDHDSKQAEGFAEQYHCLNMTYEQILSSSDIDGVMIASPAEMHFNMAADCLRSGKHVFVEKPLSLNIADGQALLKLAKQSRTKLMVGHLLQYHPAYIEAKRIVLSGELGKLHYVYSNRLSLGKFRQEENSLWSFAPHDISMILGMINQPLLSVYATGSCHLHPNIEDITTTHLKFEGGVEAHIHVSWLHPVKEQKLVIIADKGMLVFDDSQDWQSKLQIYAHKIMWDGGKPSPQKAQGSAITINPCEPLRIECEHFISCITSDKLPRTDGAEGLSVLRVLQAAQLSIKKQGVICPETMKTVVKSCDRVMEVV